MTGATNDPVQACYDLSRAGRLPDALEAIEPYATKPGATHGQLVAYAGVLKSLDRMDDALAVYNRALLENPQSAVAEHNVAALQGDLQRYEEAEAGARRAFAKGIDAPETWAVLALKRPGQPDLSIQLARALEFGSQEEDGYSALLSAIGRSPAAGADLHAAASALAGKLGESVASLRHAEAAFALAPEDPKVILLLCDAQLGMGRAGPAARMAETLHDKMPNEQQVLARLATAWRLMNDPRYRALYDYDAMVGGSTIDTPSGWPDLPSYLADLAEALRAGNPARGHPFGQSLRKGSQTETDLTRSDDPAIKAFFQAIDGPIRRYMEAIGQGADPLRRRNTGDYAIQGAWSVRLRPEGYHVDHVHQQGWLSSACHIELPPVIDAGGNEGWLKFGEPGVRTQPVLAAEHVVKPEAGRLVLFPSYVWHGTVPFSGDRERLTVAFDVVPA